MGLLKEHFEFKGLLQELSIKCSVHFHISTSLGIKIKCSLEIATLLHLTIVLHSI